MNCSQRVCTLTLVAQMNVCRPRAPHELSYIQRSGHSLVRGAHTGPRRKGPSVESTGLYSPNCPFVCHAQKVASLDGGCSSHTAVATQLAEALCHSACVTLLHCAHSLGDEYDFRCRFHSVGANVCAQEAHSTACVWRSTSMPRSQDR